MEVGKLNILIDLHSHSPYQICFWIFIDLNLFYELKFVCLQVSSLLCPGAMAIDWFYNRECIESNWQQATGRNDMKYHLLSIIKYLLYILFSSSVHLVASTSPFSSHHSPSFTSSYIPAVKTLTSKIMNLLSILISSSNQKQISDVCKRTIQIS